MSLFAITFRVHYDNERRYNARYNELNAAIVAHSGPKHWSETTSFYLITSTKNSADLANAIYNATPSFDDSEDLLVVINLSVTKGSSVKGTLRDRDYNTLIAGRTS